MMAEDESWALQPATYIIVDKGETLKVSDFQPWVDERKQLWQRAQEILKSYDGKPASLYPKYATLVGIFQRLREIRLIFVSFKQQRLRHADANINVMVAYFSDPEAMEGKGD